MISPQGPSHEEDPMPPGMKDSYQIGNERYGIVVSRFNEFITSKLLAGASNCLKQHGAGDDQITIVQVPGSFEVPLAAKKLATSGKFAAVICLGAVIRGQTDHYEHISQQVSRGIQDVAMSSGVPTLFGVITCDTPEQAIERAGSKNGNLGFQAAQGAIEMVDVLKQIDKLK